MRGALARVAVLLLGWDRATDLVVASATSPSAVWPLARPRTPDPGWL